METLLNKWRGKAFKVEEVDSEKRTVLHWFALNAGKEVESQMFIKIMNRANNFKDFIQQTDIYSKNFFQYLFENKKTFSEQDLSVSSGFRILSSLRFHGNFTKWYVDTYLPFKKEDYQKAFSSNRLLFNFIFRDVWSRDHLFSESAFQLAKVSAIEFSQFSENGNFEFLNN